MSVFSKEFSGGSPLSLGSGFFLLANCRTNLNGAGLSPDFLLLTLDDSVKLNVNVPVFLSCVTSKSLFFLYPTAVLFLNIKFLGSLMTLITSAKASSNLL